MFIDRFLRIVAKTEIINPINYNLTFRNRREFAITDTELKLIAAAAIIGESKIPKTGNNNPAAIGIPITL